jgi:LacI family transcriptional regulator, galactose operon repressor
MQRSRTPTVEDVARAAGVSTATVSRALNKPETVRAALRTKVLAAVERLGYMAHAGARAMSLRRSGTVGVIVPTIDNAIFAHGLQAFQQRMAQAGQVVLLAFSNYDASQEEAQALALLARGVDALALTGLSQRPSLMALLSQRGLPWVHTGAFPSPTGAACVGFRNRETVVRVVRYLLDLGHRRIGMLAGIAAGNDRAADRIDGVRKALRAARLPLPPSLLVQSPYTLSAARESTRALLAAEPAPTALVCGNDVLAWGVMLECQAQGIDVPGTLSVIGFDDLELSRHWHPALTTMHVPTERMWRLAADYLIDRLNGRLDHAVQHEVDVELLVRGSTAPPRRSRAR